jgi:CO dehydrogenase maturation factor
MRVAFVGKGGAGKSVIAGTLVRLLAAEDAPRVLAVDSDPLPGLAYSIGVPSSDAGIPDEAIEEAPEGERPRYRLREGLTAEEAVRRFATAGADGIRFLQFGKSRGLGENHFPSQVVFRQITQELPPGRWAIVGDLPGGTRQAFFGWGSYARTMLVVVEPTGKSMLSGRRLAKLREAGKGQQVFAVATKVSDPDDVARIEDRTGLEVIGEIPYDEAVRDADRAGSALVDFAPDAPAVRGVASLLERLRAEDARW